MTKKDQEMIAALYAFEEENGRPPVLRELGAALGGISKPTVHERLGRLVERGLVAKLDLGYRASAPYFLSEAGLEEARALQGRDVGRVERMKAAWAAASEQDRAEFVAWEGAHG